MFCRGLVSVLCASLIASCSCSPPTPGKNAATARDARPSIVLISIDTLRPDHLGLHGYSRDTSPALDAWAAEHAVIFEDAWANAPWTLPSHVSMLTGRNALGHGVNSRYPAPSSLVTLAERLGASGYRTAAWTGGSWLSPEYGLDQGFDEFRWWTAADGGESELATHVAEITAWLGDQPAVPLLLFVHTYEVHSPYRPRQPYFESFSDGPPLAPITDRLLSPSKHDGFRLRKRLEFADGQPVPDEDLPRVVAAYDSGIAHADSQLGQLLEAIERNLGDNVAVLVTSDHGEALGEGGRVSHGRLEKEDLRIPFILRLPGDRGAGARVTERVSSVDIVPTLLELAGLERPQRLDGDSVLATVDREDNQALPQPFIETYAASSNLGLSLRRRDGGTYFFNDTPWLPKRERERWMGPRSEDPGALDALRASVKERLSEATGLHLEVRNHGSEPLVLELRGPCVHPLRVKLTDPRNPRLVWVRSKHARWTVAAGATDHIRLDTPVAPCLTVEVSSEGRPRFRFAIDPASNQDSWSAGRSGGVWQVLASGAKPDTEISAWLQGPLDGAVSDPADDDALLEQLRALGYLQ